MKKTISILAVVVGIIILAMPNIVAYFIGAFLIIRGLYDLFGKK
jgi:uncharacterized membrane protein HdeD (DUF308 family)